MLKLINVFAENTRQLQIFTELNYAIELRD